MNANTVDTKQMKALAHPLRQQILVALSERVASPSELAEELGEPLGNVSYHVRMLVDLDCIELVSTTPRRGALEHHYRAIVRPFFADAAYASFPASTKRALMGDVLTDIWNDVAAAADEGTFDDPETHVNRQALRLDEQGASELSALMSEVAGRVQEIRKASAARLGKNRTSAEAVPTVVATLAFRAGKGKASAKSKRRATKKTSAKK
ncbi:MAG TPA: helix-turn-helix domain-containing protein [Solirubrobacteraceae bacterium]|nr:helix-turn-helix domain-containing protein [Solirubrobacteraceae bacterium]